MQKQTAQQFLDNDHISVIPIVAEGTCAKQPALSQWRPYQKRRATQAERAQWHASGMQAYGVVMGAVSGGLFCVDFDDPNAYQNFRQTLKDFATTYTVRTRKGYHVYFRASFPIKTRRFTGGDLIGAGGYVVGAGSVITQTVNGKEVTTEYKVYRNVAIGEITLKQWQKLQKHLGINADQTTTKSESLTESKQTTSTKLSAQYAKGVKRSGRNNTLYKVAVAARQSNIEIATTIDILADQHARTPTTSAHPTETYEQRRREAIATIHSAYRSRGNTALKPIVTSEQTDTKQLPNNLREALLRATAKQSENGEYIGASATIARVIEILHREGYLGTIANQKTIKSVTRRYKVSDDSLRKVLDGRYNNIQIMKPISHSDDNTPPVGEAEENQMFYQIPSLDDLLTRFQVTPQSADPLSDDDLRSNKAYLQAMHREFVRRDPHNTSTAYCADRLSISTRTLYSYDNALGIHKTAVVHYEALGWHNVDHIAFPATDSHGITPGIWLQRADGKRFPAIKGVALSQLKAGAQLIICTQKPSLRHLPAADMPAHDVWWIAPDGTRWGGGAYDFPPQADTAYTPPTAIDPDPSPPLEPRIVPARTPINAEYYADWLAREQQKHRDIIIRVATARADDVFQARIAHADMTINPQLTLIDGIGDRRAHKLRNLDIRTMIDMIAVGADKLAAIFSYTPYVTPRVTHRWIRQAELLLGLRAKTPAEIAQERARERAQALQQYKNAYRRLQRVVADLLATDACDNPDLRRFADRLAIWTEDPHLFTPIRFARVQAHIIAELTAYQAHIAFFTTADPDWLARWNFGTATHWRKRQRQLQALVDVWRDLQLS